MEIKNSLDVKRRERREVGKEGSVLFNDALKTFNFYALFNDALNTFYFYALFNDALNIFYLEIMSSLDFKRRKEGRREGGMEGRKCVI